MGVMDKFLNYMKLNGEDDYDDYDDYEEDDETYHILYEEYESQRG